MRRYLTGSFLVVVALSGCGGSSTAPSPTESLRLTVAPLQTLAGSPSTAEFSIRLQNVGSDPVALVFPSSCQVMPYVVDRKSGQIVLPPGGGWGCATVITNLTLAPSESHTQAVRVTTEKDPFQVAPGEYAIYARVESTTVKLQSASVMFSVR